jgi:hypothetical protein
MSVNEIVGYADGDTAGAENAPFKQIWDNRFSFCSKQQ